MFCPKRWGNAGTKNMGPLQISMIYHGDKRTGSMDQLPGVPGERYHFIRSESPPILVSCSTYRLELEHCRCPTGEI
jgi:hypothetical protein